MAAAMLSLFLTSRTGICADRAQVVSSVSRIRDVAAYFGGNADRIAVFTE